VTASEFWLWFEQNSTKYLLLNEIDKTEKEILLDLFQDKLHKFCDELYFELGGISGEVQELIITAEGNIDYFKQVDNLVNSAPLIINWKFTAFIPPGSCDNVINYEDVELKPVNMWFLPLQSKSKPKSIGIKVCAPNYDSAKKSEWFKSAVYKLLDNVLGEKSFAMDIDFVAFGSLPENPEKSGMIEMSELPAYIKWKKSKLLY